MRIRSIAIFIVMIVVISGFISYSFFTARKAADAVIAKLNVSAVFEGWRIAIIGTTQARSVGWVFQYGDQVNFDDTLQIRVSLTGVVLSSNPVLPNIP